MDSNKILRFYFLGGFRVTNDDEIVLTFSSKRSKSLLAFLVINANKSFPREVLAEAVWSEGYIGDLNKCLRQELWQIRAAFRDACLNPDDYLSCKEENISFEKNVPYWTDVEEFESILSQKTWADYDEITDKDIDIVSQALGLYEGDFLVGIYDHWCLCTREELKDKHMRLLESLMHYHEKNCLWDEAVRIAKRILQFDELREDIHYKLMLYFLQKENRIKAIKQFELCNKILKKELDIIPNEKLVELYIAIKENEVNNYKELKFTYNQPVRLQNSHSHKIIQDLSSIRSDLDILSDKISNLINHS